MPRSHWSSWFIGSLLCAGSLALPACTRQPAAPAVPAVPPQASAATPPAASDPHAASGCLPSHNGYLRVRLRGAANLDIDWHDADLQCDGSPRPGRRGVRLTFAGAPSGDGPRVRFVFGIGAGALAGVRRNLPVNVTVIFEGQDRIYSTGGDDRCTIDRLDEQTMAGADRHLQRLTARGFCVAPATAISGAGEVLLTRFDFAGMMWDEDGANDTLDARS